MHHGGVLLEVVAAEAQIGVSVEVLWVDEGVEVSVRAQIGVLVEVLSRAGKKEVSPGALVQLGGEVSAGAQVEGREAPAGALSELTLGEA